MNENELIHVLSNENYNKINKMFEEKKLTVESGIMLLKHMGYCNALKNIRFSQFERSLLCDKIVKMIVDEEMKKEGKSEKLLADLCECYLLLNVFSISKELLSIVVRCLLKVALNKEENEKTQKEVEVALLALSGISDNHIICNELYLNEIAEIIKYHQERHNLTRLAYQLA
eukprot:MONOS_4865.1-p1 / transcript=MONOS_4865.1 / gene=MONOS_4865 / organism=Monocercomonoides_exilis_PA203 / gene_product=unspecified product / transcript_product=unspecified product / location=Mono_scaffold00135:97109-97681(+) / protein_length=172 / sequence_SO=supercontig / SO=protein_coding / is_pseudo=false